MLNVCVVPVCAFAALVPFAFALCLLLFRPLRNSKERTTVSKCEKLFFPHGSAAQCTRKHTVFTNHTIKSNSTRQSSNQAIKQSSSQAARQGSRFFLHTRNTRNIMSHFQTSTATN